MTNDHYVTRSQPDDEPRSDDEIRTALDALLRTTDAVDATCIELLVTNGVVAMLGGVSDYRSKRQLEQAIASVAGVREIHDQLQVRSGGSHRPS